jgi:hypothetical protein
MENFYIKKTDDNISINCQDILDKEIEETAFELLNKYLKKNLTTSITSLSINRKFLIIKKIDSKYHNSKLFQIKGVKELFNDNLLQNNTLKELDLNNNAISDNDCLFLYNIIKNNNNLKKLDLSCKN